MKTIVLALTVVALAGCAGVQRQDAEKTIAAVLISDEQETQLGLQVHEELKKQNTKFLADQEVGLYVERLSTQLTQQASKERQLNWRWFVIDDPKTVNAFATPGGRIYVYTGLLLAAENEAEVVGVLGHEIGHVVARHSARQLVAAKGLETVTAMALGKQPGEVAQLASALAAKGAMLAYGRSEETEADEYGARFSNAIGSNPQALMTFFQKLQAQSGAQPEFMVWLSTHPSNTERINHLAAYIAERHLTATGLGGPELKAIQKRLGAR